MSDTPDYIQLLSDNSNRFGNPYLTGFMDFFGLEGLSEGTQEQAKEYAEKEGLI